MKSQIFNVEIGKIIENDSLFVPSKVLNLKIETQFGCNEESLNSMKEAIEDFLPLADNDTYCLIAKQRNNTCNDLLAANIKKLADVNYDYLQNIDKIVFSACKKNNEVNYNFVKNI